MHLSEETINARYSVPLGLVGATVLASIMGWGEPRRVTVVFANTLYMTLASDQCRPGIQHGSRYRRHLEQPHRTANDYCELRICLLLDRL